MNLSQKSLNRGRSIFFSESLVAASKKEKKKNKIFFEGTSVSDPDCVRIKIGVCGSGLGFRIHIQVHGGKIHPKII
jgi:hypothetical protein